MKAFTRHRNPKPQDVAGEESTAGIEPVEPPIDASDDFIERLGDLDRFIGGTPAPPVAWPATPPSRNLFSRPVEEEPDGDDAAGHGTDPSVPDTTEADDFIERLGDLDRFIGGSPLQAPMPAAVDTTNAASTDTSEADDFMERLGDLDRFIGGPSTPPTRQR